MLRFAMFVGGHPAAGSVFLLWGTLGLGTLRLECASPLTWHELRAGTQLKLAGTCSGALLDWNVLCR